MRSTKLGRNGKLMISGLALASTLAGGVVVSGAAYAVGPLAMHAKHGADDPAGDDRGVHPAGHAKHGADDPAGDDRGVHPVGHA
jgi:hypothetical protein